MRGWLDLLRSRGVAAVHEAAHRRRPGGPGAGAARRRTAADRPRPPRPGAPRDRPPRPASAWPRCSTGCAPSAASPRPATSAPAGSTPTPGRAAPHHPRQQGAAVPGRLPAARLRLLARTRPSTSSTTTRGARTLDVGGGDRTAPRHGAREGRRGAAAHLRRPHPRPVARSSRGGGRAGTPATPDSPVCCSAATPGVPSVPDAARVPSDFEVMAALAAWQQAGALGVEPAEPGGHLGRLPGRAGGRSTYAGSPRVDTAWRRTSYSGLIRAEEQAAPGVDSEPEDAGTVDEDRRRGRRGADGRRPPTTRRRPALADGGPARGRDLRLAGPRGARARRPAGPRPAAELEPGSPSSGAGGRSTPPPTSWPTRCCRCSTPRSARWPAAARWPTSGCRPAARARLRVPAGRRRRPGRTPTCRWPRWRGVLRRHLPADDPMRGLRRPARVARRSATSCLRGYLSGSIDVVLRVGDAGDDQRFVVVDYKTNRLGDPGEPLTALDYTPGADDRGDAALALPAAGAALLRRAAPLPALAAAGLRPRAPPRRRPLPLRARDVRAGDARGRRPPVRRVLLAPAGRDGGRALRPARRAWSTRTAATVPPRPMDRHDRRLALGATGLLRVFNEADVLERRRRPRRRRASARSSARPTSRCCSPPRSPCGRCGTARSASTWPPSPTSARATSRPSAALARPRGWVDAVRAPARSSPSRCCGSTAARLYLDRYWREERQVCDDLVARLRRPAPGRRRPARGGAGAGVPRRRRTPSSGPPSAPRPAQWTTVLTGGPGTGKTTTVAGPAGPASPSSTEPRPGGLRASRCPRRPARPRPGCRRPSSERRRAPRPDRPRPARRPDVHDPAPAARLAPRQQHPLPPRPRQPAPARRRRGRRDLDGLADDDGPAARGRPARRPAGAGRRPRPALLGRGRGGAGRPGRRAGRPADSPVPRCARPTASARRSARSPRPCATATPTRCSPFSPPAPTRSSSSTPTTRPRHGRASGASVADVATRSAARRRRRRRGRRAGRARRPPPALRPPRGPLRRQRLEPPGRAAGRRRTGVTTTTTGTPAARSSSPPTTTATALQRRHGRDPAPPDGRLRSRAGRPEPPRLRPHPAARRPDHARDDRAQVPGLARPTWSP